MRRRSLAVVACLTWAMLVPAAPILADESGRPFSTSLTGAVEIPGPGDPDASGTARLVLNQGLGKVCFRVNWEDVNGTVFAAHIHAAPAGVAGPIVVTLFEGTFAGTDSVSGCATGVDRGLIKAIRQAPAGFYVNVHSIPDFPGGAVRGQLSK